MSKISLSLLVVFAVALNGCVKPDLDGTKKESEPQKFSELVVPSGFEWKTTADVSCNFTSAYNVKVYVSTAANEAPFASFLVGPDIKPVKLSVPSSANTLYVNYETKKGISQPQALDIANRTITFALPADSKEYVPQESAPAKAALTKAPDKGPGGPVGTIYYPARENGWGTLMFEDLWPAYGDYDFNDLVVNYKIQIYLQNKNQAEGMLVGLRVKAVGGTLPYEFYLSAKGLKGGEVREIEKIESFNALESVDMVQLNPGNNVKNPPVFLFKDIKINPNKPKGTAYLNTMPEETARLRDEDMVTVAFYVQFRNAVDLDVLTAESFDFFIARSEDSGNQKLKEIHTGGYMPSEYGQETYESAKAGNPYIGESTGYYYSNANLVWAVNIPADIPHAYESTDFLKAYPNFEKWATSGGKEHTDWYENTEANRNKEYLVGSL